VLHLGGMSTSATHENGRANTAMARATRALLLVDLLARTGHRCAFLGSARAGTPRRELRGHHLLEQVLLDLGSKHVVRKLEFPDLLSLEVENVDFSHE